MYGKSALVDTHHFCITNGVKTTERTVELPLLKVTSVIPQDPHTECNT